MGAKRLTIPISGPPLRGERVLHAGAGVERGAGRGRCLRKSRTETAYIDYDPAMSGSGSYAQDQARECSADRPTRPGRK